MTKLKTPYQSNHPKEHKNQQHCSICNTYVKHSLRYPNYICKKCSGKITDKSGTSVQFSVTGLVGRRCEGRYIHSKELYNSHFCYVSGIKCKVEEHNVAGVVISPVKQRKAKVSQTSV